MQQKKIKHFAKKHWMPLSGFLISSGLALYFGFTFLADAIYFNDPRHQDEDLQGWMTPRYVTLSYDVPMTLVLEALGLNEDVIGKALRMENIAAEQNSTLDELTKNIRAAAQTYREAQDD